jgi:hypothetical protein
MTQRTADLRGGVFSAPRFDPWANPLLEWGNDLCGDARVDAVLNSALSVPFWRRGFLMTRALKRAGGIVESCHRGETAIREAVADFKEAWRMERAAVDSTRRPARIASVMRKPRAGTDKICRTRQVGRASPLSAADWDEGIAILC